MGDVVRRRERANDFKTLPLRINIEYDKIHLKNKNEKFNMNYISSLTILALTFVAKY